MWHGVNGAWPATSRLVKLFRSPTSLWFGHSSYLITNGVQRILVDPVFAGHASPFRWFGRAFRGADVYKAQHMPDVDVLLLTHDHYDHLCMHTLRELAPRTTRIITSLGEGAHLERWGVPRDKITELDWWEDVAVDGGMSITATPARHFSGRAFKRGETLWSSFSLDLPGHRLFLGADSGYGAHFAETTERPVVEALTVALCR
jgi:L-ascorbate metabolism protein UlaG (beta-lactamase superfamily)